MYRQLSQGERDKIERRQLIEMAARYGRHQDAARERQKREIAALMGLIAKLDRQGGRK